jgi:hypothetical protein
LQSDEHLPRLRYPAADRHHTLACEDNRISAADDNLESASTLATFDD